MNLSKFEINENSEKRYMHGKINFLIRLYYYLKEGVNQISGLRTVGYGLIGIAGVLAIDGSETSYWIIGLIGLASIPVFILLGYIWVKRAKKSEEYFNLKYTTTFGRYAYQLQERQMELLEELNKNIKELSKKLNNTV